MIDVFKFPLLITWSLLLLTVVILSEQITRNQAGVVQFLSNNYNNITRVRRQSSDCGFNQFKCDNGNCIGDDLVCDGTENCADGSDETDRCRALSCQPFAFTCKYGACIDRNLVCDGRKDCKDFSDERPPACNTTTSICEPDQFQCSSKNQCISEDDICDGKANCSDGSDETVVLCGNLRCQNFSFRCSYGACINKLKKCDGKTDCVDGSDESVSLCGGTQSPVVTTKPTSTPPIPTDGQCILPNYPQHGSYSVSGDNSLKPGKLVMPYTVITFHCDPDHAVVPQNHSICISGKWTVNVGECLRTCGSVKEKNENTMVECSFQNSIIDCDVPVHGMIAKFSCKPFYETFNSKPTRKCMDGTWDMEPPTCTPICGQKTGGGVGLVIGGQKVEKGLYPWQASVFSVNPRSTPEHVCGATIISPKAVLSAAHCFTFYNGTKKSVERYLIGAGKYYRDYKDERDKGTEQYSELKEIKIPARYYGEDGLYSEDIAVVILKKSFELTQRVQPVCIDWRSTYEAQQLIENIMGLITGWGYTASHGEPSDELQELWVPFVPYERCRGSVPKDFTKYITPDKICSGYLSQGKSVCQGDSGGGLVFENSKNDKFYIRGIVSNAPKKQGFCDLDQYALYTKVSRHIQDNYNLFDDI